MIIDSIKNSLLHKTSKRIRPVLKNTKSASYFTITLTLFSLSFFGLFAIRPTLITAVSLIKEVKDLRKLSLDYENKISNFITAQSEYERIRESIPLIDRALPQYSEFPGFARTMENIAIKNSFSINQFQIDAAPISLLPEVNKLNNFNFILVGIGNYDNSRHAIEDMVNSLRIVTIESLDFSTEGGTVSGNLRVSLKGKSYYEP